jgi:hypothetical protein
MSRHARDHYRQLSRMYFDSFESGILVPLEVDESSAGFSEEKGLKLDDIYMDIVMES